RAQAGRGARPRPRVARETPTRAGGPLIERADGPLVGRIESAERVDLVAEEFDPDRQRRRGREHVDDPTPPGELAAPRDLARRHVPEPEKLAEKRLGPEPAADAQAARLG